MYGTGSVSLEKMEPPAKTKGSVCFDLDRSARPAKAFRLFENPPAKVWQSPGLAMNLVFFASKTGRLACIPSLTTGPNSVNSMWSMT